MNKGQKDNDWFDISLKHLDHSEYAQALVAINEYLKVERGNRQGKLLKALITRELSNYKFALKILKEKKIKRN